MKKPLAGKKAFEAMGRRHTSLNLPRMFYDFYRWPQVGTASIHSRQNSTTSK